MNIPIDIILKREEITLSNKILINKIYSKRWDAGLQLLAIWLLRNNARDIVLQVSISLKASRNLAWKSKASSSVFEDRQHRRARHCHIFQRSASLFSHRQHRIQRALLQNKQLWWILPHIAARHLFDPAHDQLYYYLQVFHNDNKR
jgi:hypothetical protein